MRKIILSTFFVFSGLIVLQAQTYETISVLQPFPILKAKKSKKTAYGVDYIDFRPLNFDIKVEPTILPDLRSGFTIDLNIPNNKLVFEDKNETTEAYLNIYVRIMSENKKNGGISEEKLLIKLDKSNKEEAMKNFTPYRKVFELLTSGKYKIDILIRDMKSGDSGIQSRVFEIPASK